MFERLINKRIIEFIQINNSLNNVQCGCRKRRSTVDHLVRLESTIRKVFAHREHFISIFFNQENAYDMTWRGGILSDLSQNGHAWVTPKILVNYVDFLSKIKILFPIQNPRFFVFFYVIMVVGTYDYEFINDFLCTALQLFMI